MPGSGLRAKACYRQTAEAVMRKMTAPDPATYYPIDFGESFGPNATGPSYHSLQYKFKPQSAGRTQPGNLHLDSNSIALQVPNVVGGQPSVAFEGKWAPTQHDTDCVAIFDGARWRIEALQGSALNLRHTSGGGKSTAAPASPNAAAGPGSPEETELIHPMAQEPASPRAPSRTPDVLPPSETPSLSLYPSVTPSLSRQASPETSPSEPEGLTARATPPRPSTVAASVPSGAPSGAAATPGPGRSPSVQPPGSPSGSSTTSTSSDDSELEVGAGPLRTEAPGTVRPTPQQYHGHSPKRSTKTTPRPASAADAPDMQDFEREFFENDSDDESDGAASDSSGNQSEEEAKHF